MRSKQDKQPRRPSKSGLPAEQLHPASDMGKRAKDGDKFNSGELRGKQKSSGATSTPPKKPNRP